MARFVLVICRWLAVLALVCGPWARAGEVTLPRFPSVSPDGRQIVFSWRGDLWRVDADGGEAFRLTAHPADDLRSAWSPDGQWIAFESTRDGRRGVHLMRPDGTRVRAVTSEDASLSLSGFSADGRHLLLSGFVEGDTHRAARPYRVPVEGGPLERLHGAFGQHAAGNPDGVRYVFERGGTSLTRRHYRGADNRDLFLFDARAGSFRRLTEFPGHDAQPDWRGEDTVVFLSDRGPDERNAVGLWALDASDSDAEPVRLTDNDEHDVTAFDVSADGRTVAYTVWDGLYVARFRGRRLADTRRLRITAPDDAFPRRQSREVGSDVEQAALSPDGKVLATVAFGQVLVRAVEEGSPTRRVTTGSARARDVAWSPDMSRLYFVTDEGGSNGVYAATVSLTRGEIRDRFEEVTDRKLPEEPGSGAASTGDEPADDSDEAAAEADAEDGEGDTAEGPEDVDNEAAKDEEKPKVAERWHDALRFDIHPVVVGPTDAVAPAPSPDGRTLAYRAGLGDLVLLDLVSGEQRTALESWDFRGEFRWSPTGDHLAVSVSDEDFNADVLVLPADGSWGPVNVSQHPGNDTSPRWSSDGRMLAFLSERQGEGADVFVVMLDRTLEALTSQDLDAYFKERAEASKKRGVIDPIDWDSAEPGQESPKADRAEPPFTQEDLADAYRRLRRVTRYPGNESSLEITPAGDRVIFRAAGGAGGSTGLYSAKWDGSDEKRIAGGGGVQHLSLDGTKVVLVSPSGASTVSPTGGSETRLPVSHTLEIDPEQLNLQKFHEMARTLGSAFYHPTMKGLDWAALTAEYAELARRAWTSDEFAEIGARLMGELSASHLGVTPPSDYTNPDFRPSGRLGIDATPIPDGGFRVDRVLPRLRTTSGPMRLRAGDVITAIELEPLRPGDTLDARLAGRTGQEVVVTVQRDLATGVAPGDAPVSLDLLVTPVSLGEERAMRYDDWQLYAAAKVDELSGGRLGYLHIRSMGATDLVEYERDLFAAAHGKEGLILDVRSNGGGWTTDRVLASLMYPQHAYTVPRGADPETRGYPRDRLFIQRFTGPANLLCNEKSYSNAEIISHAFKTLGRGTLVGQQTHGSVISTGGFTLVDGTRVRLPFRGWYLPDGTDMENNGAMPDLVVEQTPEDEAAGIDRQLEAAVADLLGRLDG